MRKVAVKDARREMGGKQAENRRGKLQNASRDLRFIDLGIIRLV